MLFDTNKHFSNELKLRGGFYTPVELARYLVDWGIRSETRRILEPSCGDGNFVAAILERIGKRIQNDTNIPLEIVAVELNQVELKKAKLRVDSIKGRDARIRWIGKDFFESYSRLNKQDKFDLIVGNPPFIRFQYFDENSRELAFSHLRKAGYKPSKLDNAWVAFVELSMELLKPGGCLAMVVPAELLQVKYAHQLRKSLTLSFEHIVLLGFKKLVFPEIQQEVFLLLAEGKRNKTDRLSDIHTLELRDGTELLSLGNLGETVTHIPAKHTRNGMKWTSLFLDDFAFKALDVAEKAKGLSTLGKIAKVNVGIVTGRNSYFILTEGRKNELQAEKMSVPIVGRTAVFRTTAFNKNDFSNYKRQYPSFLLNLNGVDKGNIPQPLADYIKIGEHEEIHLGYKCRIRKRWFDVPSIYIPDLFLYRQIHRYPLMVVNKAHVTSTDTIHRVRLKETINGEILAAVFFNSLTLGWAEVCGRSYGGGVLELEPREAEELPIPYSSAINIDVEKVETLLRTGRSEEALDYVDGIVLKNYLGFDQIMLRGIRRAWEQLRDRRLNRNR